MTAQVGVVVPALDAAAFIGDALASAGAQGVPIRIVVVDDGSTDGTAEVVRRVGGAEVVLVRQANAGPAAARNRGLERTCEPFVAFLDADDEWPEDKLRRQLAFLDAHPDVDVVLGRTRFVGDLDTVRVRFDGPDHTVVGSFLGAGLFRRAAFERVGPLDESLRTGEDYDWLLRARELGVGVHILDDVTLHYRVHPGGTSRDEVRGNRNLAVALHRSLARRRAAGVGADALPVIPTGGAPPSG